MDDLFTITQPTSTEALAAFTDLTGFYRASQSLSDEDMTSMLDAYYELVGRIVEDGGGKVVKFMGDAAFMLFSSTQVNEGVAALLTLKTDGDAWLSSRDLSSRQIIKAHFGPVCCAPVGTSSEKRFDAFGQTICIAATMRSDGLAISAQAFRKLTAETRKAFKKHTPPVTYIPVGQRH